MLRMDDVFYLKPINLSMVTWNWLPLCLQQLWFKMIYQFNFQIINTLMKFWGVLLTWFDSNGYFCLLSLSIDLCDNYLFSHLRICSPCKKVKYTKKHSNLHDYCNTWSLSWKIMMWSCNNYLKFRNEHLNYFA